MLLLCLLIGTFLCTHIIITEAHHRTLHQPICHLILQKLVFKLKVDYAIALLDVLLQALVSLLGV
jgi:hypothetical protein